MPAHFPRLLVPLLAGLVMVGSARLGLGAETQTNQSINISIARTVTVPQPLVGLGIQWDPYSYPPRPAAWQETLRRLDFARPAFFRVMTSARSYCLGFDGNEPRYVWTQGAPEIRQRLGSLLDILDYAQSNHIAVLLGEWSPPGRLGDEAVDRPDDPRWARLAADFIAWLRRERGYTVVRQFNLMNEPNGDWMWPHGRVDYAAWAGGIKNLRRELDGHGLTEVAIVGPDNAWGWEWVDRVAREMPDAIGAWEMHWYATDKEVLTGEIRKRLSTERLVILANDPQVAHKPMFLAESGLVDGKTNVDQQPRVKTFEYGVMMADYAAQVFQAGWQGLCAWDLDDALHVAAGGHVPVPTDKTLKIWGFWNTQGTAMGHPEDEAMRPWFYAWSLMSRLFPRDAGLLPVTQPELSRFRVVAASLSSGKGYSVMLVNNTNLVRNVHLVLPGGGRQTVVRYHYFENDRPADAAGFAVPKETTANVDLAAGMDVTLPGRGIVFLEIR